MRTDFSLDLVSAEFPCGAAWLANALIELNLHLAELWSFDTAREWQQVGAAHRYVAENRPWRQTLAALQPGREFSRVPGHTVRCTHGFPWQLRRAPRSIIVLRDPRDALYSQWRRQQRNHALDVTIDLPTFASSPFPGSSIAHSDYLWLHMASWLTVAEREPEAVLLLRFEDCKTHPVLQLQRICRWLALAVSDSQLATAADASDVRHLQQIEEQLAAGEGSRVFNRAGRAFEWMSIWPVDWHRAIGPHWAGMLVRLNYEAPEPVSARTSLGALDRILEAAGNDSTESRARWFNWLVEASPR